jgi:circadian clock protein KaiC
VVTLLVMAQHGVLGQDISSPIDISYLADTVVLLRYFEHAGQVRNAISVVKNRQPRKVDPGARHGLRGHPRRGAAA